jgi:hypothetical protein
MIDKIKDISKELPEKKKYFEFIASILSIPILVTVLITNYTNLTHLDSTTKTEAAEPRTSVTPLTKQPTKVIQIIRETPVQASVTPAEPTTQPSETPAISRPADGPTKADCIKKLGSVDIASPNDGEVVTKDPLMIDISYKAGDNCAAVWSYRINNGDWSQYTDKSISVFNLASGSKNLEVKVKSIVSDESVVLRRTFSYKSPQETKEASTSASVNQ